MTQSVNLMDVRFRESLRRFAKIAWDDPDYFFRTFEDSFGDQQTEDGFLIAWRAVARAYIHRALRHLEKLVDKCESPIEELMLFALCIVAHELADNVRYRIGRDDFGDLERGIDSFRIEPQAQCGPYRVDFLVHYGAYTRGAAADGAASGEFRWASEGLVVECDGHEFHERTKDQAQRDKERDRELQKLGYRVFHYTGRDIWVDVVKCAKDALDTLRVSVGQAG